MIHPHILPHFKYTCIELITITIRYVVLSKRQSIKLALRKVKNYDYFLGMCKINPNVPQNIQNWIKNNV